ncbi:MAG: tRNA epoxyqueuosine(34) reductase QueG [Bacteroidota bacterium]
MNSEKQILKKYSEEIGFCKFGVAAVQPLDEEIKIIKKWIGKNQHSGLKYIEKNLEKKKHIEKNLKSAKSVIVVAQNYYYPIPDRKIFDSSENKISRHAVGLDYHIIMQKKLTILSEKLSELYPESESRQFIDSNSVLEKQWAVRAGIGWQGKNSLILTRSHGSWIFLGVIVTTAEIEPDKPSKNYCGTCTKCIDLCPTKAIIKDKVLDLNKCISYWTIESKSLKIPAEIRKNSNGWIYGCDICQEVCPWNKFAKISEEQAFAPHRGRTTLSKEEVEAMDEYDFNYEFSKSSIIRRKLKGLFNNLGIE